MKENLYIYVYRQLCQSTKFAQITGGNKAVCVDAMRLSAKLLQTAAPGTRSHTALFSHSLDTGMVPCKWKSANVSPVPKAEHSKEVDNLTLISIFPVAAKVFEHTVH